MDSNNSLEVKCFWLLIDGDGKVIYLKIKTLSVIYSVAKFNALKIKILQLEIYPILLP